MRVEKVLKATACLSGSSVVESGFKIVKLQDGETLTHGEARNCLIVENSSATAFGSACGTVLNCIIIWG